MERDINSSITKPTLKYTKVVLVRNAQGYPFVWHNLERDRIEIRHGEKLTVIQMERDTPVFRTPWEEKYRHLKEVPIKDIDNGTIASFIMGNSQMEFDLFVIRHSRKITCFAIPKDTMFQIQWETAPRVA